MRVALCVEYDGAAFHGWQTQPDGRTVQDALEMALSEIAGTRINVTCAGRTDTGVHATAQIVHFDCAAERPRPLSAWVRGANTFLPDAVAVRWAHAVPPRLKKFTTQRAVILHAEWLVQSSLH